MKKLLLLLTYLLISIGVYSQNIFEKIYGGSGEDEGNSVLQTFDGGFIITGSTNSFGAGGLDVYVIRTNEFGDTLWTKTFGGTNDDVGYSIAQTSDSGFVITGYTNGLGPGTGICLIRIDSNGDSIWTRNYYGIYKEIGYSVAQTTDGGFIITGSYWPNGFESKVYLMRTNSTGDTLWTKKITEIYWDYGKSVIQASDGGFIITGTAGDFGWGYYCAFLIKTDQYGNIIWTKIYGDVYTHDAVNSFSQTNDSGYIIIACDNTYDGMSMDIKLIKTNANGDSLWTKRYGSNNADYGFAIKQLSNDNYIILGKTNGINLLMTNSLGDTLWTKTYTGAEGTSLVQTNDKGYIITGINYWNHDVFLLKTDSNCTSNGTLGTNNILFSKKNNISVNPNPAIKTIHIQIPQQFGHTRTLAIYDCIGQLQLIKTDSFSDIDVSSLKSGIYFIVLTNLDNEKQTIKLIKE